MKDNILKKEFKKKDVERLRNLVKGNGAERTGAGVGYTKRRRYLGRKWSQMDYKGRCKRKYN